MKPLTFTADRNRRNLGLTLVGVAAIVGWAAISNTETQAQSRVSRPNEYTGYATKSYDGYQRSSFYIAVRDQTRLAVDLYRPTNKGEIATEKLPVIWMHSPYNRRSRGNGEAAFLYPGYAGQLVPYGYNVAVVDFRGLYASFGKNAGFNRGEWMDAARMDAYDVTEWFAKQAWSSGNIGMWGCSATGGSEIQAATTAPPSLKAIFPMSTEFDAYPFQRAGGVAPPEGVRGGTAAPETTIANRDRTAVAVDGADGPALLQAALAQHASNVDSMGEVPFRDSLSNTLGVTWWMKSSPYTYIDTIRKSAVGIYAAANWDEAGTKAGAFAMFRNLNAKLVVGPEAHCDWNDVKANAGFEIVTEELRFFDYWLKGVKNGVMEEPRVTYYTYNAPEGKAWRRASTWPLPNEVRTPCYLGEKTLSRTKPAAGSETVAFNTILAPAVSTIGPKETPGQNTLAYLTPPLTDDLEVTGHPVMNLWMSANAADADILARIEDVAPDGTSRTYNMHGQFRASRRPLAKAPYDNLGLPWHSHKAADARPLTPGTPSEIVFDMLPMSYIFKAGHQLRLVLVFSDPKAPSKPDASTMVTVLRGPDRGSFITLPVIPAGATRETR
jgi:putative CocE/NonD family hydrolase